MRSVSDTPEFSMADAPTLLYWLPDLVRCSSASSDPPPYSHAVPSSMLEAVAHMRPFDASGFGGLERSRCSVSTPFSTAFLEYLGRADAGSRAFLRIIRAPKRHPLSGSAAGRSPINKRMALYLLRLGLKISSGSTACGLQ
ncbi:hypothetical protein MVEN_00809000 [Mycena venus]|uniref:Uncharacterized protein n=1 Tax=Mycena venus TaxID=2733690 RepID=A0A8H6YMU5_9AGAR|nr:hypothetical protein MVEN_00809000 [Mycena venus]